MLGRLALRLNAGLLRGLSWVTCYGALGCHDDARPRVCTPESELDLEEWQLASAEEAGVSLSELDAAIAQRLAAPDHGIDSLVVIRHGKLVTERYWTRDGMRTPHDLRSATKSITSLLVGIAIDHGAIAGVEEPVLLRLKEAYPNLRNRDPWKDAFTLEHLLTMRPGLACNDWDANSIGNEENMYARRDWVRFFLDLPVQQPSLPPSRYCTAGVVTLGRVLKEATQQATEQFVDAELFAPLGIRNYCWETFDEGQQVDTGGHFFLRPRDMAKIGQLVLQRGQWQGQQLISESWIDQSTREHSQYVDGQRYGYLWWLRRAPMNDTGVPYVTASGNGGQYIMIVPDYDLVVVFTGSNYNSQRDEQPFSILASTLLPLFTLDSANPG